MSGWLINSYVFKHPFTCLIVGPSGCGKTQLLTSILQNKDVLFNNKIDNIIFCYKEYQPSYDTIKNLNKNVYFNQGVYEEKLDKSTRNLIIFDDLMKETIDNSFIQDLFTIDSHHRNTSVILISHNLFPKGKHSRTISLNTNYLILFNNPRDKTQINVLARQIYPENPNFLLEVFEDAIDAINHGYLFLDFRQDTLKRNRIQTNIIPNNIRILYTPKSK
jgi:GTPase SAR1 family protein